MRNRTIAALLAFFGSSVCVIFVNCFLSRANSSIKSLAREGFSQFMPPYRTITSNEEPLFSRLSWHP